MIQIIDSGYRKEIHEVTTYKDYVIINGSYWYKGVTIAEAIEKYTKNVINRGLE